MEYPSTPSLPVFDECSMPGSGQWFGNEQEDSSDYTPWKNWPIPAMPLFDKGPYRFGSSPFQITLQPRKEPHLGDSYYGLPPMPPALDYEMELSPLWTPETPTLESSSSLASSLPNSADAVTPPSSLFEELGMQGHYVFDTQEQPSPVDPIVDASVDWKYLFGEGQFTRDEPTSLAALLEDEAQDEPMMLAGSDQAVQPSNTTTPEQFDQEMEEFSLKPVSLSSTLRTSTPDLSPPSSLLVSPPSSSSPLTPDDLPLSGVPKIHSSGPSDHMKLPRPMKSNKRVCVAPGEKLPRRSGLTARGTAKPANYADLDYEDSEDSEEPQASTSSSPPRKRKNSANTSSPSKKRRSQENSVCRFGCGKTAGRQHDTRRHEARCRLNPNRVAAYPCMNCPQTFSRPDARKRHWMAPKYGPCRIAARAAGFDV